MLVWTIHSYPLWEKLQHDGVLYGPGPELVDDSWRWRTAYDWMVEQMERRMDPGPSRTSILSGPGISRRMRPIAGRTFAVLAIWPQEPRASALPVRSPPSRSCSLILSSGILRSTIGILR